MIVEGALFDIDGARPGYARIEAGRVVETGQIGTDSSHGHERRVRGIVTPSPLNGHTHLGDAVSTREPPAVSFSDLVAPPDGYKFRLLAGVHRREKIRAMRAALGRMRREGIAGTIDFREEGLAGARSLRQAAARSGLEVVILGRPVAQERPRDEIDAILEVADGIGLSSAREEAAGVRRRVADACAAHGKRYALHASEEIREDPADYLEPKPDLVVHLTRAEPADIEQIAAAKVAIAACPRSNALFGRRPLLREMERAGAQMLLGTDNAMLLSPSVWSELEFAYVASRSAGAPVSATYLARAALVEPWRWLGREEAARIAPGTPARPLVHRLPPDDPAYQLVTRATEHLMVFPAAPRSSSDRGGGA